MKMHEEISKVAYDLFEKNGRQGDRDLENWCEAETIVMARHAEQEHVTKRETAAQAGKKAGKGVKGPK